MNLGEPFWDDPARGSDADVLDDRIAIQFSSGEPTRQVTLVDEPTKRSSHSPSLQKRKKSKADKSLKSAVSTVHTPPSPRRKQSKKRDKEVDFYRNPTILSRLIMNQRYAAAIKRVHRVPRETKTWACVKRRVKQTSVGSQTKTQIVYTLRQLPIHMACANLCRTKDVELLKSLNELITCLVVANPAGSFESDHDGRLPVFNALMYGANVEAMSIFLMADPNALEVVDPKTKQTLPEANKYRCGDNKEEIEGLLKLGSAFWQRAHEEAELRLRSGHVSYPSEEGNAPQGVSSMTSLRDPETETIVSADSDDIQPMEDDSTVQTISWSQLEERAIALEEILTAMNEKNFELHKKMEEMTKVKSSSEEVQALHQENLELSEKLQLLQTIMERTVGVQGLDDEESMHSRLSTSEHHPLAARYNELYARHQHQRDCIRILQRAFQALVSGQSESSEEYSDDGGTGRASSITWSTFSSMHEGSGDRKKTSGGESSAESQGGSAPRRLPLSPSSQTEGGTSREPAKSLEVQWTPTRGNRDSKAVDLDGLRQSIGQTGGEIQDDSLSVLFRAAAAGDVVTVEPLPERRAPEPVPSSDNLSGMFRRAAAHDVDQSAWEQEEPTADDLSAMLRQAAIDPDRAAPSQDDLSAMWRQASGGQVRSVDDEDLSAIWGEGRVEPNEDDLSAIWQDTSAHVAQGEKGPDDLSAILRMAAATPSSPELSKHNPLRARPSKDDLSTMLRAAARSEVTVASGQVSSGSPRTIPSIVAPGESGEEQFSREEEESSFAAEGRYELEEEIMQLSADSSVDAGSPASSI